MVQYLQFEDLLDFCANLVAVVKNTFSTKSKI